VKVVTPKRLLDVYQKIAATGAVEIAMQADSPDLLRVLTFRPLHDYAFTPEQLHSGGPVRPANPGASPHR
jgi:hypothetical protein